MNDAVVAQRAEGSAVAQRMQRGGDDRAFGEMKRVIFPVTVVVAVMSYIANE
jgi:hypothetical protein